MKTILMGAFSQRVTYALAFLMILGGAAMTSSASTLHEGTPAFATYWGGPQIASKAPLSSTWNASTALHNPGGTAREISVNFQPSTSEYSYTATLSSDNRTLYFSLTDLGSYGLPANTTVAIIEVSTPDGQVLQTFEVNSDGGGIIITIDEI